MEIWTLLTDTNAEAGGLQYTAVQFSTGSSVFSSFEYKVTEFVPKICVCVGGGVEGTKKHC